MDGGGPGLVGGTSVRRDRRRADPSAWGQHRANLRNLDCLVPPGWAGNWLDDR